MTWPVHRRLRPVRLKRVLEHLLTLALTAGLVSKHGQSVRIVNHRFYLEIINRLLPRSTRNANKSSSFTYCGVIEYVSSSLALVTSSGKNL